ncbi:tRNA modification GTPase MnmE [uncultured Paludibacter sp.]|uniref:tRNA modification GTPase MnmE n=1 Tax=uncultured Paludibacter sp. TaxID=497635 RepID=A0A653AEX6_9BACT|nr:tRNA modification GTPase MnmE [uncultured Paludibacter sp.]
MTQSLGIRNNQTPPLGGWGASICAISTAPGTGGIAVIRVSGKDTFTVCDNIFQTKNGEILQNQSAYTVHYGNIINEKNEIVDEVLVTVFKAPHSFTGEDVVEISCHGSVYIQQKILQLLIHNGCELAKPGEFTMRAFRNGKMDLSQAEAVADLIASNTAASHRMALNQMRGGFSAELKELRTQLLNFVSLIELELDFTEEDVEFADRSKLKELANHIEERIFTLANSFKVGNVLKSGIPVALVGETNVGKSTLLNLLLNEEKAIVSDIHGTTRDVIEDLVNIDGITFRFIDTAGIRKTTDTIENLGIERTYQKIEQSEIVLWLIDCTQITEHIEWLTEKISKRAEGKKIILVFNKIDKLTDEEREVIDQLFSQFEGERIYISAKKRINTDKLQKALVKASQLKSVQESDIIVNNIRHYEALIKAQNAIQRVIDGLENGISGDFLSQDIRECMYHLGEITGQISNDEILGNIFSKFCIGK